ncbi:hypothetical protein HZ326_8721 [Fusarium oxysporum f. sp. albedinis]|nr:hypothetical protein HZ326_8721 [Fusarium oxysporum f. sp. albedinis]
MDFGHFTQVTQRVDTLAMLLYPNPKIKKRNQRKKKAVVVKVRGSAQQRPDDAYLRSLCNHNRDLLWARCWASW